MTSSPVDQMDDVPGRQNAGNAHVWFSLLSFLKYLCIFQLAVIGLISLVFWPLSYSIHAGANLSPQWLDSHGSISFRVRNGHCAASVFMPAAAVSHSLHERLDWFEEGFGLEVGRCAGGGCNRQQYLCLEAGCPLWFPAMIFLSFPAYWVGFGPLRRIRRRARGHCEKCAYDLRGNESGICPECGTKFSTEIRANLHG